MQKEEKTSTVAGISKSSGGYYGAGLWATNDTIATGYIPWTIKRVKRGTEWRC